MSWYATPTDENFEHMKEDNSPRNLWRFKVDMGQTKRALFLCDEQFALKEHRYQTGKFWELFTCSGDKNCYFCGMGVRSSPAQYSTVLDLTPYTGKDGVERKFSRRAFRATGSSVEVLNRRRLEKGQKEKFQGKEIFTLTGYIVKCFKDGDKAASCGNDFQVMGERQDLSRVPVELNRPIDFKRYLAPLERGTIEAKIMFGGAEPQTVKRSDLRNDLPTAPVLGENLTDSEDIPF